MFNNLRLGPWVVLIIGWPVAAYLGMFVFPKFVGFWYFPIAMIWCGCGIYVATRLPVSRTRLFAILTNVLGTCLLFAFFVFLGYATYLVAGGMR
jgi:hypothetical protein